MDVHVLDVIFNLPFVNWNGFVIQYLVNILESKSYLQKLFNGTQSFAVSFSNQHTSNLFNEQFNYQ